MGFATSEKGGSKDAYFPFAALSKADIASGDEQDDGRRGDGRIAEEMRPVCFRTGLISRAAGSAYAEWDRTKVMVGVYGPRRSTKLEELMEAGRLRCDVKVAAFAVPDERVKYGQGDEEREYSLFLERALRGVVMAETFPKAQVDVFALVLQSGGADLAAVINCASLALAHAGIAMRDLVSCVHVSRVRRQLLLDPALEEQRCEDGHVMLAYASNTNSITHVVSSGVWLPDQYNEALTLAKESCTQLDDILRSTLREQVVLTSG